MLLLLLTFLNLFDYSSVGVLSLLFWGVAWWWYHCRTRHLWSWWPNPGPGCQYKIISISLTHWRSPRPSWRCPAPCRGSRPTGGGTLPRLSRYAPSPVQYGAVQYSTVQHLVEHRLGGGGQLLGHTHSCKQLQGCSRSPDDTSNPLIAQHLLPA